MLSLRVRRGLEQRRKTHISCRGEPLGLRNIKRQEPIRADLCLLGFSSAILFSGLEGWRMNSALDRFQGPCPLNSCRAVKAWLLNPFFGAGSGITSTRKPSWHRLGSTRSSRFRMVNFAKCA